MDLYQLLEDYYQLLSNGKVLECAISSEIKEKIYFIARCQRNKAPIRYLLSGFLAKIENPFIDLHKPYDNLGKGSYNARSIDENIVQRFVHKYNLPCNATTAFLTPAFRTFTSPMNKSMFSKCRPNEVYYKMCDVVDYIEQNPDKVSNTLKFLLKNLIDVRTENQQRIDQLKEAFNIGREAIPLSSEDVVKILIQHLSCKTSSRLPVLIVTAAYRSVSDLIGETAKELLAHNAADSQTGAMGDIEIIIPNEEKLVTCYEMKKKEVSCDDVSICYEKILSSQINIDNYIIITTEKIAPEVKDLAASYYDEIGIEIVILDCVGFIRHFLHFFHRRRMLFLNNYQELVLKEPDSAVSQPLKEAFLTLRGVAETSK